MRAAEEYAMDRIEQPRQVNVVTDVRPVPAKRSRRRRTVAYLYEHYLKAIIIGVVVAILGAF
jgi:hypothetical protein